MNKIRLTLSSALTLILLMVFAGTALGGSPQKVLIKVTGGSDFWVVPALEGGSNPDLFQCPEIPTGTVIVPVEDESERTKKAFVKSESQNGVSRITLHDTVLGIATDEDGGTYTYRYKNKATISYDGFGTAHVKMIDTFRLQGEDVNYVVSFNWRWSYLAPMGIALIDEGNNLGVEPFGFPTDDGFNENAFVIPGTWQQIHTNGFIYGCDPV